MVDCTGPDLVQPAKDCGRKSLPPDSNATLPSTTDKTTATRKRFRRQDNMEGQGPTELDYKRHQLSLDRWLTAPGQTWSNRRRIAAGSRCRRTRMRRSPAQPTKQRQRL